MGTRISGRPTFGGLASGLDTNALLKGLLEIERQPLNRIEARRSEVDNQRGLVRQLNSRLLALRDSASALDNRNTKLSSESTSEELLKYKGSSTNEDVVEVTAGAGASPGDIQVRVEQLARGSRRFSTAFTADKPQDATALTAGQSITIALPNADPDANPPVEATSLTITADTGTISLASLRDRINTSADNGGKVRADILQVSEGSYQLVLSSTESGSKNELQITGDLGLQAVNPDGSDNAQSAVFHLFGQRIERQSNVVEDVLTGVTLKLNSVAKRDVNDQPITETVSIAVDVEAIATAFEGFIDNYNDVLSFLDNQSKYNETTKTAGPLSGDFMLRDVQRQLREAVSLAYRFEANPNNPYAPGVDKTGKPVPGGSITGIGIEVASGGRLRLNRERLEEVLAEDPLSLREFLSGNEGSKVQNQQAIDAAKAFNARPEVVAKPILRRPVPEESKWEAGFFTEIGERLESIVRSGDGLLAQRDKLFGDRLKTIDNSIDQFNSRLALREETLIQRFSALERVVSGLQNQQGFLSSLR
jgi:flagellar hook-associated protein 2